MAADSPANHTIQKIKAQSIVPPRKGIRTRPEGIFTSPLVIHPLSKVPISNGGLIPRISISTEDAIERELAHKKLLEVPSLIEHIFSENWTFNLLIGYIVDRLLCPSNNLWDAIANQWVEIHNLDSHYPEQASNAARGKDNADRMAKFLNQLIDKICEVLDSFVSIPTPGRRWASTWGHEALCQDSPARRRPQLAFMEETTVPTIPPTWKSVLSTAVLNPTESEHTKNLTRLSHNSWMAFCTQDNRRFFLGVSFSHFNVCLYVFDRSGVVGSQVFNLNAQPARFIYLLAGLLLGRQEDIGLDPSIYLDSLSGRRFVDVATVKYEILETIFMSDALVGSGTVCWRARAVEGNSDEVVIKTIWADEESGTSEREIMDFVANVEGVAKIIASEIVLVNGRKDNTDNVRLTIQDSYPDIHKINDVDVRALHRMVITPYAQEIIRCSSKRELVSALIDAIQAHKRLIEKGVLHCDINTENIMIYQPHLLSELPKNGSNSGDISRRKGLLIDLGCAIQIPVRSKGQEIIELCSGTLPLTSTETSFSDSYSAELQHKIQRDLESFLYVLIWICWNYPGPKDVSPKDFSNQENGISKDCMQDAYSDRDFEGIGIQRFAATYIEGYEDAFINIVLYNFSPYFEDLKTCVLELRRLIFGRGETRVTHDEMIAVLEKTQQCALS